MTADLEALNKSMKYLDTENDYHWLSNSLKKIETAEDTLELNAKLIHFFVIER
jgi:hypothetical protein